uniref:Uncharacterized protein n=1 Tax=viral metagenome TaxID=1070528 RepID=A0A6C0H5I8_9ZZZZ
MNSIKLFANNFCMVSGIIVGFYVGNSKNIFQINQLFITN